MSSTELEVIRPVRGMRAWAKWRRSEKVAGLLVGAGMLVFMGLGMSLGSDALRSFDEAIIRAFRRPEAPSELVGPRWFREAVRDFTALGGYAVLLTLTVLVYLFLRLEGRKQSARFALGVILLGYVLSMLLKTTIDRPRPDVVPHLSLVDGGLGGPSFPSGHSMMSTVVYVTLALMLAEMATRQRVKVLLVIAPALIACSVGLSRVLMGVHYPSDVFGGWAAGVSWALLAWLAKRAVESDRGWGTETAQSSANPAQSE